ncbi:MAG: SAM-dependent methyltransferase, partial [Flavobacteriales bacterium]|nr:SAM-dependent methyltransferase [Flavobacteriales bacterium]
GPSSILMTLMASGLNGQQFSFHGYLPKDRNERIHKLKSISQSIAKDRSTHLFMDTPFRNKKLMEDILKSSPDRNRLCIARDITGEKEWIKTKTIGQWKNENPNINKIPVMFALGH